MQRTDPRGVEATPSARVEEAVERAAGRHATVWRRILGRGYTPAERWVVGFEDGTGAFAKVGTTELTAGWLRVEHQAYLALRAGFMPRLAGWSDGEAPVLLLEDLSEGYWPPPWQPQHVEQVLATLRDVAQTPCPNWARPAQEQSQIFSGWSEVATDPEPFLSLGLVSREWLERSLPALVASENPPEVAGEALLHFDVRSDNICFAGDRVVLVDWNWIGRGNPLLDVAAWLPSLHYEGGPPPDEVCPEAGMFAPALAGYFAAHAPQPIIPDAPHVRRVQYQQLTAALPWAARVLGLPPLDGPGA